jgi:hypothetical protein
MSAFYDQASLVVVPSGYKSGKIYAQKPLTTDGQLTFTRASTATRVNASGLIEEVASGVPRLDYTNSSCPKLLLEPQRTNLVRYSEQFDNAAWTKSGVTISANAATSPEGDTHADSLIENSSNTSHVIFQGLSPSSTGIITGTIYIKDNNRRFAVVSICTGVGGSIRFSAVVDLQNGVITQNNTLYSPTNTSSSISNAGNGWYRVSVGLNCTTTAASSNFIVIANSNTGTPTTFTSGTLDPLYTGDGSSVFLWGAQVETGAYATSYVKTEAAAVTRLADAANLATIPSSTATSFTIFADWEYLNASNAIFSFRNTSDTLSYTFYYYSGTWDVFNGAAFITNFNITAQRGKIAIVHTPSTVKVFINGADNTKAGASPSASLSQKINFAPTTTQDAALNSLLYIPSALTDSQAIELTTL